MDMNNSSDADTTQFDQPDPSSSPSAASSPDPAAAPGGATRSRRTKRVVTSVAVSAVLLGSGAAIGMALTGGASASTGSGATDTGALTSVASTGSAANAATAAAAASPLAGRCAKLALQLRSHGHPLAAIRLRAFCTNPLLRLALVGGAHGEVTFQTKAGPKSIAVERGTIQSVTGSGITVLASDGTTWTWDFTTATVVREAGQAVARDKLTTGESVLVGGQVVSGVHDARLIRIRTAG
jgi:hypothetical protein